VEQLGVVEERMDTLMGRLDRVSIWDKRQEMDDEQFTPVVSALKGTVSRDMYRDVSYQRVFGINRREYIDFPLKAMDLQKYLKASCACMFGIDPCICVQKKKFIS